VTLGTANLSAAVRLIAPLLTFALLAGAAAAQDMRLEKLVSGLDEPVFLLAVPGDAQTLLILEKKGRLRAWRGGEMQSRDVLDLREKISDVSERGLLGMAFHPKFGPENRAVFIHYSDKRGNTIIARFLMPVPAEPDSPATIDPKSEKILLTIEQPWPNHNGGMIAFGPKDGYLYVGMGDGGAANDPNNAGQDLGNLLGKILRIDVDQGETYGIPPTNPFVKTPGARPEIWAWGIRNAWRFCFDPENGDLWIGDIGQNLWEEIDWLPGNHPGGANFGWRILEGTHDFNVPHGTDKSTLVPPVYEFPHGGKTNHCSVSGGYVYRGSAMPWLRGSYFWADYCSNVIGTLRVDRDGKLTEEVDRTSQLDPEGKLRSIVSFGEDAQRELYVISLGGTIWKIVPG
jgi:glucose/arabinose dehydrogenase